MKDLFRYKGTKKGVSNETPSFKIVCLLSFFINLKTDLKYIPATIQSVL